MNSPREHIHFIGIGGTAMASVAVALKHQGHPVTGSDQNLYPPMSTFLEDNGLKVMSGYHEANLASTQPDLIVVGNAISRGNPEVEYLLEKKLRYCSLPELLKNRFIQGKRSLVVSGTHGKTTTSSLLAWLLHQNQMDPSFLIGGIPANFGRGAHFSQSPWIVLEGDEYDTAFFDKRSKFVHYLPEVAIINNLEFDHADIFDNLPAIQLSFKRFINLIPRNGLLLANGDDPNLRPLLQISHCPVKTFGLTPENQVIIENLQLTSTESRFTLQGHLYSIPLIGELYVRNAAAAALAASHIGISPEVIQHGFNTFQGIKRRMEVRGVVSGVTVIDDFGHHPTALAETLKALRVRYPNQRIWALFEPRSNTTRRNVLQRELTDSLALADVAILGEVARLQMLAPEDRLDPMQIQSELSRRGITAHYLPNVEEMVETVVTQTRQGDVICLFSNGGFGGSHQKILDRLPKP